MDNVSREEIYDKWLAALRSGEYKQGKHYLRKRDDTYCCLGVVCDVLIKDYGIGRWVSLSKDESYFYALPHVSTENVTEEGAVSGLPQEVGDLLGLDGPLGSREGFYFNKGPNGLPYRHLASANDNAVPFDRIAQFIEELRKDINDDRPDVS